MASTFGPEPVPTYDSLNEAIRRPSTSCSRLAASDLLLSCGSPPRIRKDGRIEILEAGDPPLTPTEMERLLRDLLQPADWKKLIKRRQVDFAFTWRDQARIRGNAYYQRDSLAAAFRLLPLEIPSFDMLGCEQVHRLLERHQAWSGHPDRRGRQVRP
jgi:Tfp pilus assembly pilus retraction ATPase PilT